MISFIRGKVADLAENIAIIENQGIGYEVFMTSNDLMQLKIDQEIKVHTYFHVREDVMQLYGFVQKDDLNIFKLLLNVNGIGPKGAIAVLSGISADELRFAVLSDDIKTISKAPGIGKKTAQKLILELKDKLSLEEAFEMKLSHESSREPKEKTTFTDASSQAVEALVALGYSSTDALKAVKKVSDVPMDDVEAILRAALKNF
ncbi:MAG: Holliday junction branch migration protein RuvA [Eubacteriales bacterium]|nr:Holliday junction branch migration protein RuvA [Eubacteriales bacterium]